MSPAPTINCIIQVVHDKMKYVCKWWVWLAVIQSHSLLLPVLGEEH